MMTSFTAVVSLALLAVVMPGVGTAAGDEADKVKQLVGGFKFTEGPAVDAKDNICSRDIPHDRIRKWSEPLTRQAIISGADARIEQIRKRDALLALADAAGQPLTTGTVVTIEQIGHHFLQPLQAVCLAPPGGECGLRAAICGTVQLCDPAVLLVGL
jgi:ABC-type proline/glycine betaine transport system permease subunit